MRAGQVMSLAWLRALGLGTNPSRPFPSLDVVGDKTTNDVSSWSVICVVHIQLVFCVPYRPWLHKCFIPSSFFFFSKEDNNAGGGFIRVIRYYYDPVV